MTLRINFFIPFTSYSLPFSHKLINSSTVIHPTNILLARDTGIFYGGHVMSDYIPFSLISLSFPSSLLRHSFGHSGNKRKLMVAPVNVPHTYSLYRTFINKIHYDTPYSSLNIFRSLPCLSFVFYLERAVSP